MPWFPYPALSACGKIDRRGHVGSFDVVLVTGDAYADHPAFAAAVVTRLLERLGLSVAVIAQPQWGSTADFMVFGTPNLFFGVTSGAMDSMVANLTSMRFPRKTDRLSPGGRPGLRPKRALQVYVQRIREAFPEVPIAIGGIEASLRRFAHFDFWEDRIRDPILIDAPADVLLYGMAEGALSRLVDRLRKSEGRRPKLREPIAQTCFRVPPGSWLEFAGQAVEILPTAEEIRRDPRRLLDAALKMDSSVHPGVPILVQPHPKGDIVCFPPSREDWLAEPTVLDRLRFNRRAHPLYDEAIPGLEPVQFSVVSHRGCVGGCTFCALALHQGRRIRSRSQAGIIAEIRELPNHPDFRGTVPDVGGPSVNMYGWHGFEAEGIDRLVPGCKDTVISRGGLKPLLDLLTAALELPGIRHVFLGSGLRYDLLHSEDRPFFLRILQKHVSGQLKVAPEHLDRNVLALMRKGPNSNFENFIEDFRRATREIGKELYLVPYFMTAFPGAGDADELIAEFVKQHHLAHEQIQEFTPTPGTLASAMYHAKIDLQGRPLPVAKTLTSRASGRRKIQGNRKKNR
ncbi:YgiQ family radical SAM protein [bacterium CG2_30_54_10]|nr:MAG: YgiQ family radical SAM protein [bacterium CG2_30_54_10]